MQSVNTFLLNREKQSYFLLKIFYYAFGGFSLLLAAYRAWNMPITVDEGITYADHIVPKFGLFDFSAANNHFLNTFFVKIFSIFAPFNAFAIRLPTLLIGAWLFLFYVPSKKLKIQHSLAFLFICLSPYFSSEYWSLGRGYFMSGCFAASFSMHGVLQNFSGKNGYFLLLY